MYAPVQLIWNARLPPGAKLRLITIFAATLVTTGASLYYIYAMLRINGITEEFAATVHVCNNIFHPSRYCLFSYFLLGRNQSSGRKPLGHHFLRFQQ